MTITLTDEIQRLLPSKVRRKAGFKKGDKLEVKAIGGMVTLVSKPTVIGEGDEYTPEQRRVIDARLAKADEDIRKGRTYGPFDSADEMIASMKAELRKRTVAKKSKRPR